MALHTHAPASHCCPAAQGFPLAPQEHPVPATQVLERVASHAWHARPAVPHSVKLTVVMHEVPAQQPLAQFAALQP